MDADPSSSGSGPVFVLSNVSAAVGMSRFFGALTIQPGRVVFEPRGRVNTFFNVEDGRCFIHADQRVTVVSGRLRPPWLNSGLVLADRDGGPYAQVAVIQMPGWERRRVVEALGSAGFEVDDVRTWFSMGGDIGSIAELKRFRDTRDGR